MTDVYVPPQAELAEPIAPGDYGSIERALAGEYEVSIGAILREAWASTPGAKGTINIALLIYFLIAIAVMVIMGVLLGGGAFAMIKAGGSHMASGAGVQILNQLVTRAVFGPLAGGLFIIGLRRAVKAPISAGTVLQYFHKVVPILVMSIIKGLLVVLGLVLLILPGIYLVIAYQQALPLIVEKNLGPWQALEASRKSVTNHWFPIFGLVLVLGVINVATVFTLFIAAIWTVPMSIIAVGILYRNMYGIEADTLNG